jgi:hypothetical protein
MEQLSRRRFLTAAGAGLVFAAAAPYIARHGLLMPVRDRRLEIGLSITAKFPGAWSNAEFEAYQRS